MIKKIKNIVLGGYIFSKISIDLKRKPNKIKATMSKITYIMRIKILILVEWIRVDKFVMPYFLQSE